MGLSATQARYLTLTMRKSDLELQAQTNNTRRLQLAYKTADIATAYAERMNNTFISYKDEDGEYQTLTAQALQNNGYMLIGVGGAALPGVYAKGEQSYSLKNNAKLSINSFDNVSDSDIIGMIEDGVITATDANGNILSTGTTSITRSTSSSSSTETSKETETDDSTTTTTAGISSITVGGVNVKSLTIQPANITTELYTKYESFLKSYVTSNDWSLNKSDEIDVQDLLGNNKAQIVSQDFYNYITTKGWYDQSKGWDEALAGMTFDQAIQAWDEGEINGETVNTDGGDTCLDWRSDTTGTAQVKSYTADDEVALAEYERQTADIQKQDKILEVEAKNIETQHKAIETEIESVKKVKEKHIEDTFKIFS